MSTSKHWPELFSSIEGKLTKQRIVIAAADSVERILDKGLHFPAVEQLKAAETFVDTLRKNDFFTCAVRDELIKHGGRITLATGTRLELCEAGVRYDYSYDEEWRQLNETIQVLQQRLKQREELLRKAPPGEPYVDEETGEVITGAPKTSKSSFRVLLKP